MIFLVLMTVLWDAVPSATGYKLLVWREVVPEIIDVGNVTQYKIDLLPEQNVAVIAYNEIGNSYPSVRVEAPIANGEECNPPLGKEAIGLAILSMNISSATAGRRAQMSFSYASASQITKVEIRMNGLPVGQAIGNDVAAMNFTLPQTGTYNLSLFAQNEYGCAREVLYRDQIVVK